MTLPWRNYTCVACHLSHIITSIHHTFLPQVHHITPAKGQRPSFTLHIEAKLPHSVLVQLNPRAFSINHLVKKTAPKSNINNTTVDFHHPGTNRTIQVPYYQIFQTIRCYLYSPNHVQFLYNCQTYVFPHTRHTLFTQRCIFRSHYNSSNKE
jgi:hypothetical protein